MRVTRWPALITFLALIIGASLIEGPSDPPTSEILLERPISSVAGSGSDLASIWYCVSGTVGGAGIANHEIILGNKSNNAANIALTITPVLAPRKSVTTTTSEEKGISPEAIPIKTVLTSIVVPPRTVKSVTLADIPKVGGEFAAAMVESDVGDLIVEHRVVGTTGMSQSNCQSYASEEWYFAGGTTREGVREVISVFNPYADSAVIDMTFVADGRIRRPVAFSGLVVPPRSLLPIDITDAVTLSDIVSTVIKARNGRIVAERLLIMGDEFTPNGLSLEAGVPSLASLWVFPGGVNTSENSGILVYNPSETQEAGVDIEIYSDFAGAIFIEPISLLVAPGSTETVILGGNQRDSISRTALDGSSRVPSGIPNWIVVRGVSGPSVAAERLVLSDASFPQTSSSGFGVDVAAQSHVFVSTGGDDRIAIVHPSGDRLTQLQLFAFSDGEVYESLPFEISAKARKVISLQQFGVPSNSIVQVVSSEPVLIERMVPSEKGNYWTRVIPAASSVMEPNLPYYAE
ncbi:MAG: DUF5719 family protein [Acidimicrobiales bacterium]|nr:DUF5719 family protein [Acidimicrobiales bacterium]